MHNSKIISVFRHYSKEDWQKFEKFVVSPYLNNGRNYINIIKEIKKFHPSFDSARLTKEYIYSKLYPGKEYKDTVMKTMLTGLFKLAEKYIMLEYLNSADYEKEKLLSHAYAVKGEFEGLHNSLKSLDEKINKEKIFYDYFYFKQTIESGKVLYYQRKSDKYVKHQEHSVNRGNYMIMDLILKLPQILNDSYFSHIAYNESKMKDISFAFAGSINFKKFINEIDSLDFQYRNICKLFTYTALLFTETNNTDNYFKVKILYKECFDELSFQNQYILGLLLSNYCAKRSTVSSKNIANEIYEICDFMVKKNIFFGVYGSFIPHRPFIEFVNSACECNKLEQAEDFINNYSDKLHEKHRHLISKRCLAQVRIFQKNFNDALELLKDFNSDDINEIIELKRMQSMIYYELGLYDTLDYTLDSSIKMIRTNKMVSERTRNGAMIFFKFIKKLAEIRQKEDKSEAQILLKTIKDGEYFLLHYWILQKAEDLLKP